MKVCLILLAATITAPEYDVQTHQEPFVPEEVVTEEESKELLDYLNSLDIKVEI